MPDLKRAIRALEVCTSGVQSDLDCTDCPYHDDCESHPMRPMMQMLKDALALLKEQEPRVMTLEEVRQMGQRNMHHGKAPCETCVYERRGCIGLATCSPRWDEPQFEGDQSHLDIQYLFLGTDEYDVVPVKKYGFEIRCWHGCPTDEQREATPW